MEYSLLSYFLDENRFTNFQPIFKQGPYDQSEGGGEVVQVVVY